MVVSNEDYKVNGKLIDSKTGKRIGFSCVNMQDKSTKYLLDSQIQGVSSNVYFKGGKAYLKGDNTVDALKEIRLKIKVVDDTLFYEWKAGIYKAFRPLYIDHFNISYIFF